MHQSQITRTLLALWGMARPLIMLSVIQVYVAGTLIARARGVSLDAAALGWGLVVLLLVSLSIHYTNEYADHETDALARQTPFSGGSGVLPRGLVPRRVALQAAWVTVLLGILVAVCAVFVRVLPLSVLPVLVLGAVGGWMYSLPPLQLAWRGWGELDNALLGGTLLTLYGFTVQVGRIEAEVIAACVPFTGLAFLNLLATTWADRDADAQAGKYTLATRWSVARLRLLYGTVAVFSLGSVAVLYDRVLPSEVALASWLVLPFTAWGFLRYTRTDAPHASVYAMIVMLAAQMSAWFWVGFAH